jgi:hypothetical protein
MSPTTCLACACGQFRLTVQGDPITSVACHCDSCRAAGARLQRLPCARPLLDPLGGTRFVLYRKDRIRFTAGMDRLKAFRLSSDASTRRVLASCCNTPVFLEFKGGHWLSLYGGLWPDNTLPPLEMRTMTGDLADASFLPADVPNFKRQSFSFFARLLNAWIAMGFRSPRIEVGGEIHA